MCGMQDENTRLRQKVLPYTIFLSSHNAESLDKRSGRVALLCYLRYTNSRSNYVSIYEERYG